MTHDPLCPFFYDHTAQELVRQTGNGCVYCQLIARVREDERRKGSGSDYADGFAYAIREVLSVLERFDDVDELPLMLAAIRAPLKEK